MYNCCVKKCHPHLITTRQALLNINAAVILVLDFKYVYQYLFQISDHHKKFVKGL